MTESVVVYGWFRAVHLERGYGHYRDNRFQQEKWICCEYSWQIISIMRNLMFFSRITRFLCVSLIIAWIYETYWRSLANSDRTVATEQSSIYPQVSTVHILWMFFFVLPLYLFSTKMPEKREICAIFQHRRLFFAVLLLGLSHSW